MRADLEQYLERAERAIHKPDPAGFRGPVMEKVGSIIAQHILGYPVEHIYLVGGTSAFSGIANVITEFTHVPTTVPCNPLFVTPLGIAMHHQP